MTHEDYKKVVDLAQKDELETFNKWFFHKAGKEVKSEYYQVFAVLLRQFYLENIHPRKDSL